MWYYIRSIVLWSSLVAILSYWSIPVEPALLIIVVALGLTLNEIVDCAKVWLFKK